MKRIAIVQFDDRSDTALGPRNALLARNYSYAKMHGYHYEFTRTPERDVPPYWNKVFLVEKILAAGVDIVGWLDSDAVIHDFSVPLESLFEKEESVVFASDLPIYKAMSPINTGVFFCRGAFGLKIMREWQTLYPAHLWKKNGDNRWNVGEQNWAGPAFEQGCFAQHLFPKYASAPEFKQLSWKRLQSPYPQDGSLTLHFPRVFFSNSVVYLQQIADANGSEGIRPSVRYLQTPLGGGSELLPE